MEMEYSSEAIIAAMSPQTYTVRHFLIGLRVIDITVCYQYMYGVCYPNSFLLVLTQLSIHGYIPDICKDDASFARSNMVENDSLTVIIDNVRT
jgi:hypothetical protein